MQVNSFSYCVRTWIVASLISVSVCKAHAQDQHGTHKAVVKAACTTVDMNHVACAADAIILTEASTAKLIHHLCSYHNAWGTSNVFTNCVVNASEASEDPNLINAVESCITEHSWASEYFLAARAECLHGLLNNLGGPLERGNLAASSITRYEDKK